MRAAFLIVAVILFVLSALPTSYDSRLARVGLAFFAASFLPLPNG